ncbi:uncharacterized protein LOC143275212 [Babylonia areolata]|uniref:uncharacterized protein LOC143275212 n=1 Tax=Babylonia areolata TaxID=304850 RepID=UPI003FD5E42C
MSRSHNNDPRHPAYSFLQLLYNATTTTLPTPSFNITLGNTGKEGGGGGEEEGSGQRWAVLGLLSIIVCSVVGNVLVCLAVCWERRLQNMTNYFLMSLAIADLLVSVVVMPLGMIVELFGYFPLEPEVCVVWVSSDVLMCTASIWHMCTMSMDRFFTLKYPMRYGRNKTKTMVVIKIFFVWVVSMAISSPICIHGFLEPSIVYNDGVCVPVLKDFVIYGSVFAFYVPLLIMIVTYVLTIHILWKNQRTMRSINNQADLRPRLAQMTAQCSSFLVPHAPPLLSPEADSQDSRTFHGARSSPSLVGQPVAAAAAGRELVSSAPAAPSTCLLMPPPAHPLLAPPSSPVAMSPAEGGRRGPGGGGGRQGNRAEEEVSDSEEEEIDLPSTHLLQDKSMSYKSLCTTAAMSSSREEFFQRAASPSSNPFYRLSPSEKSGSLRERRPRASLSPCSLEVGGGQASFRRGRLGPALYNAVSDTQLPSASCPATQALRPAFHQSFNGLESDCKSAEWDRRFFQIQQEMDDCLQDAGEGEGDGDAALSHASSSAAAQTRSEDRLLLKDGRGRAEDGRSSTRRSIKATLSTNVLVTRHYRKMPRSKSEQLSRCVPSTPPKRPRQPVLTSDSEDNEADTSGSSNSDMITIRLHPPTSPQRDSGQQSASEDLTETSALPSVLISSEADNTHDESDVLNTNDESPADSNEHVLRRIGKKHKRLLKARFRNTLRASARPMFKHLLSRKTASNERKASKVLGIIFLVFVILWTPFFIVNIMSVTCKECMHGVTNQMMSVFVWMGYVASLANPIIYTMFNTAFRRTFIHILTCRINRFSRRMKFSDLPTFPSVTTTMPPSERRGTMTIVLDHRT